MTVGMDIGLCLFSAGIGALVTRISLHGQIRELRQCVRHVLHHCAVTQDNTAPLGQADIAESSFPNRSGAFHEDRIAR